MADFQNAVGNATLQRGILRQRMTGLKAVSVKVRSTVISAMLGRGKCKNEYWLCRIHMLYWTMYGRSSNNDITCHQHKESNIFLVISNSFFFVVSSGTTQCIAWCLINRTGGKTRFHQMIHINEVTFYYENVHQSTFLMSMSNTWQFCIPTLHYFRGSLVF